MINIQKDSISVFNIRIYIYTKTNSSPSIRQQREKIYASIQQDISFK
jgi:hypothetical protein